MKILNLLSVFFIATALLFQVSSAAVAQTTQIDLSPVASDSSTATDSSTSTDASAAAQIEVPEKKAEDITVTTPRQKSQLAAFLEQNPPEPLTWYNFLQHGISQAVEKGLPANIVVLIILFPIIASIIAASRHIIGLQGFGVYIPAVLSVAFVSTGIATGLGVFTIVLLASVLLRYILKKIKLQYLPRTAMMLWGVSVVVLLLLIGTTLLNLNGFINVSIFPLLIIILLTENFMETQLKVSRSKAFNLTIETVLLSVFCSLIISSQVVQQTVIIHPEITILFVAVFNFIIGKYNGLRLLEYVRFKSIMED